MKQNKELIINTQKHKKEVDKKFDSNNESIEDNERELSMEEFISDSMELTEEEFLNDQYRHGKDLHSKNELCCSTWDVIIGKDVYHDYYGEGVITKVQESRNNIYIKFDKAEVNLNIDGLGKYYKIIVNDVSVNSINSNRDIYITREGIAKDKEKPKYRANCYVCQEVITETLEKCNRCGWYRCSCGACGCGYQL